jgi:hypothetical protein
VALGEAKHRLSVAKIQWHLSLAGVSKVFVESAHTKQHESNVREVETVVDVLEKLLREGMPGPSSIVVPLRDGDGDVA